MTTLRLGSSRLAGFLGIVSLLVVTPHLLAIAFVGLWIGAALAIAYVYTWGHWLLSLGYFLLGSGQLDPTPKMTGTAKAIEMMYFGFYPVALVVVFKAAVLGLFTPKSRKTIVINVGALLLALGLLSMQDEPLSPLHGVKSGSIGKGAGKIEMPVPGKTQFVGCLVTAALLFQLSAVLRPAASSPVPAAPLPKPPPPAPGP